MTPQLLVFFAASLVCVPLSWAVPRHLGLDVVALWSLVVLMLLSPASGVWLVLSSIGTVYAMRVAASHGRPGAIAFLWCAVLLAPFGMSREVPGWTLLGAAYFTLRNMHLVLDGWMNRLAPPNLRDVLRYQLFLPVIASGPIHRFQNFTRETARRRFDCVDLAAGAERALFGLGQAVVIGGLFMGTTQRFLLRRTKELGSFIHDWVASALSWIELYFQFAGLSSVALGISLMAGLRLEENFNRPYAARNLIDFWTRWHITLSLWCRDYVFQPVTAITRRPVIGLGAALLAIGLWHETSPYYVLWSLWQALGIVGSRVLGGLAARSRLVAPYHVRTVLGPVCILGWLSLAQPVLTRMLSVPQ